MSTEKFNLILKDYPEYLQLSKEKRGLWVHQSEGDNIPMYIKKDLRKEEPTYSFDANGWVIDNKGNKVIRNKLTAGKPNMLKINGQSIWNGLVNKYTRNKLKDFLTEYYTPFIIRNWPINLFTSNTSFFHFEFIFYFPIELRGFKNVQDIDNHSFPYVKAFTDTLTELQIIPDDGVKYYRGVYSRYVNIPNEFDRRLEIKLHFCDNTQRLC